jgi:DNA-directed RNA polymerase subunit RPC12/RpoP
MTNKETKCPLCGESKILYVTRLRTEAVHEVIPNGNGGSIIANMVSYDLLDREGIVIESLLDAEDNPRDEAIADLSTIKTDDCFRCTACNHEFDTDAIDEDTWPEGL